MKTRSNAQRGAYYKSRTRKWLLAQGWQVGDLEVVRWLHPRGRSPIPVKRDQFASDLIAVNAHAIVFVQVKGGASVVGGTFPAARRAFEAFVFPMNCQQWVVAWPPLARAPRIVRMDLAFRKDAFSIGDVLHHAPFAMTSDSIAKPAGNPAAAGESERSGVGRAVESIGRNQPQEVLSGEKEESGQEVHVTVARAVQISREARAHAEARAQAECAQPAPAGDGTGAKRATRSHLRRHRRRA